MASTSIPKRTRAVIQANFESTDLTRTELEVPIPNLDKDEHLIKVAATSPCAGELHWFKAFPEVLKPGKQPVPCYDLAGTVVLAPNNSPYQPGAEVYTRINAGLTGNLRDYTIAVTSELALKPKNISFEDAASVPLSAFTAYQELFEHGELVPGWKDSKAIEENATKRVIITAASGGVGVWTVQLAKAAGVGHIIAVVGPDNVDFIKELGATEVINYREQSLGDWAKAGNPKADVVIDHLGGQTLIDAWSTVKEGGRLVGINTPPDVVKPSEGDISKNIKSIFFIMKEYGWQLEEVAKLIEEGKAKPIVDSVVGFDDYQKAFDRVASGRARGKVIISLE